MKETIAHDLVGKPGQFWQPISCWRRKAKGGWQRKRIKEILEEAASSLGAMANASGGKVILNESDHDGVEDFLFAEEVWHSFLRRLHNFFSPPMAIEVTWPETAPGKVACLSVEPSPEVISLKNGKTYLRLGSRNVPLSRERIKAFKQTREETWHEREVLTKSSLADLDETLLERFFKEYSSLGEIEKNLYRPYGLIDYAAGRPLLTRAAVYLLAKDPLRWHANPGLEFIHVEGTRKGYGPDYNIKKRVRLEGPILKIVADLDNFINQHIQERVIRQDLFFKEKFVYPTAALKEAIINALVHRDYKWEGQAIEVYMYDDRLEVLSPGSLPGVLNIEYLLQKKEVHYARNPRLARFLTDLGIMRSMGTGIGAIFAEMERNGLNPPEIKLMGNCFVVILKNAPGLDGKTLHWLKKFSPYLLNSRQIRILVYARAHGLVFSSADYQKLGVDRDVAYTEIKDLINKGIVRPLKRHGKIYQVVETAAE